MPQISKQLTTAACFICYDLTRIIFLVTQNSFWIMCWCAHLQVARESKVLYYFAITCLLRQVLTISQSKKQNKKKYLYLSKFPNILLILGIYFLFYFLVYIKLFSWHSPWQCAKRPVTSNGFKNSRNFLSLCPKFKIVRPKSIFEYLKQCFFSKQVSQLK